MPDSFLHKLGEFFRVNYLQFIFIVAFTSVLGSLYFSEVLHIEPCSLCWYQRIFMYPMAVLSFLAIVKKDTNKNLPLYFLGLAVPGSVIALYQYILQMTTAAGSNLLAPCSIGKDCAQIDVIYFDFLTLPLLSFFAFTFVTGLVLTKFVKDRKKSH